MKKLIIVLSVMIFVSCSKNEDCYETNKKIFKSLTGFDFIEHTTNIDSEFIDNKILLKNYLKDSFGVTPCD